MNEKYLLLVNNDRELCTPLMLDTLEEARNAMKSSLIEIMGGAGDSIFDEFVFDEDYYWKPDGISAWFNSRKGNHDWKIIKFDDIFQWTDFAKSSLTDSLNTSDVNPMPLMVLIAVDIKPSDIDDIMCAALEGGITHWCSKAEVIGEYLGSSACEQISRGGSLILHDAEENTQYKLTLNKFMKGLRLFLSGGHSDLVNIKNNSIDPCDFDGDCADMIIQLALFDKITFS